MTAARLRYVKAQEDGVTLNVSVAERAQLIKLLEEPDVATVELRAPLGIHGVERRHISVNLSIREDRLVIVGICCLHAHFAGLENAHGQFAFVPYLARAESFRCP